MLISRGLFQYILEQHHVTVSSFYWDMYWWNITSAWLLLTWFSYPQQLLIKLIFKFLLTSLISSRDSSLGRILNDSSSIINLNDRSWRGSLLPVMILCGHYIRVANEQVRFFFGDDQLLGVSVVKVLLALFCSQIIGDKLLLISHVSLI